MTRVSSVVQQKVDQEASMWMAKEVAEVVGEGKLWNSLELITDDVITWQAAREFHSFQDKFTHLRSRGKAEDVHF